MALKPKASIRWPAGGGRNPGVQLPTSGSEPPRRWPPRFAGQQSHGRATAVRPTTCIGPWSFLLTTVCRSRLPSAKPADLVPRSAPDDDHAGSANPPHRWAFDTLKSPQRIEVLVTRVLFRPGQPHGIALANASRMTRPSLKVIFTALPEVAHHATGQGRMFIMPVRPDQIVQAVEELLNTPLVPSPERTRLTK